MKILAIEHEYAEATSDDFRPHLKAEAMKVWGLVQAGVFREIYLRADNHCAVIVMETANVEEAKALLGTLPLVKAGLIAFEVIPLVPYSGFARLFFQPVGMDDTASHDVSS